MTICPKRSGSGQVSAVLYESRINGFRMQVILRTSLSDGITPCHAFLFEVHGTGPLAPAAARAREPRSQVDLDSAVLQRP